MRETINKDYELAAEIVDLVLKSVALNKLEDKEGRLPMYSLSLDRGEALIKIARMISSHRINN